MILLLSHVIYWEEYFLKIQRTFLWWLYMSVTTFFEAFIAPESRSYIQIFHLDGNHIKDEKNSQLSVLKQTLIKWRSSSIVHSTAVSFDGKSAFPCIVEVLAHISVISNNHLRWRILLQVPNFSWLWPNVQRTELAKAKSAQSNDSLRLREIFFLVKDYLSVYLFVYRL